MAYENVELHEDKHTDEYGDPRGINDGDVAECGECGRQWCYTCHPTPASRCPFEYDHEEQDATVTDSERMAHATSKVTHWIASLEANRNHMYKRGNVAEARALAYRAHDLRAVLAILDGSDDEYIRAVGGMRAAIRESRKGQ